MGKKAYSPHESLTQNSAKPVASSEFSYENSDFSSLPAPKFQVLSPNSASSFKSEDQTRQYLIMKDCPNTKIQSLWKFQT